ncbi:1,2-phenylacetyl-CoA epoxidase subunit PaaD [Fredinandcohnia onubensis]|uniref:1,2-phenylacetyl-CoA epoxidase subunit PaaD n=1 Tax=Fredinandcohnia onubensis TaxID=1571209 RepID=UPI000C0BBB1F|nr:1,2-phenylacetyl-CoA epoxidase subunit PaaD [Fredinandcohnia onubensis]
MEMLSVEIRKKQVYELLETIDDPELPISILDLGIVKDVMVSSKTIQIKLIPTFSGCPALEYIENLVKETIEKEHTTINVHVDWDFNGDWGAELISKTGVEKLQEYGIAVALNNQVNCPYCNSVHAVQETQFGTTLCREIYYCNTCKNPFEKMKHLKKQNDL